MDYFEQQTLRRSRLMPTSQRALDYLHDAFTRLGELGWRFGPVPDCLCEVAFIGHCDGYYQGSPLIHIRSGGSSGLPECWYRPIGGLDLPQNFSRASAAPIGTPRPQHGLG